MGSGARVGHAPGHPSRGPSASWRRGLSPFHEKDGLIDWGPRSACGVPFVAFTRATSTTSPMHSDCEYDHARCEGNRNRDPSPRLPLSKGCRQTHARSPPTPTLTRSLHTSIDVKFAALQRVGLSADGLSQQRSFRRNRSASLVIRSSTRRRRAETRQCR